MKMKKVGLIDEPLSVIGFGCWPLSGKKIWNNSNDRDSIRAVEKAVDLGVNLFDVAPIYGYGHAEEVLGKALKGKRDKVLIATKCGLVWDDEYRDSRDLSAKNIYREIDASLRRLGTDYVDIYQLHWPDHETNIEETIEAMINIKELGKIRYIGLSNFPLELTKKAMEMTTIASQQGLYNMLERNSDSYHELSLEYKTEEEILPFVKGHNQAFFPYSPLFQGLLTGKFKKENNFDDNDVRINNPNFEGEVYDKYFKATKELKKIAKNINKPMTQLALNWLIKNDAVTSIICGAQNSQHVRENVGSIEWELSDDVMQEINSIVDKFM